MFTFLRRGAPLPNDRFPLAGNRADFETALAGRQQFAGVEAAVGVEHLDQALHHVETFWCEDCGHHVVLFHANPMLAGDRSADVDAVLQNLRARFLGAIELIRVTVVEQNDRVYVPVSGVKDVADL